MQFIRKCTLAIVVTLFTVSLFWFVALFSFSQVLSAPEHIKEALKHSGIYNTIITDALAQAQKDAGKKGGQGELDIPVNDKRVREIINQAFPPSYLQTQTEGILDSTYAWVNGDTDKLEFSIDVSDAKLRLAQGVSTYVREKAAALPPCAPGTMLPGGDFDAFDATCLPPGMTADIAAGEAYKQIMASEFLKDAKLSADSIKDEQGKTLGDRLEKVPTGYQRIKRGLLWLGICSLLLGTAVVFLSATRRAGGRKIAVVAITVGALSALFSFMMGMGMNAISGQLGKSEQGDQPLTRSLFKVVEDVTLGARSRWLYTGIALIVAGIATLVILHVTKPKKPEEAAGKEVSLPVGEDAIGAEPAPPKPASFEKPQHKKTRQPTK